MSSNFLHTPGTSGFIVTPFKLLDGAVDTSFNALTNGSAVVGSTAFSQSSFSNAQLAEIWLQVVTAGWTPTVGGCLSGWFLKSTDGGSTFEAREATASSTVPALGRSPDFVIPVYEGGAALAAGDIKFCQSGPLLIPWTSFKVLVQNNCGVTLGAGAHLIYAGPVADQY